MSENRKRGEGGKFTKKVTEQDILKVFDRVGEPMTAPELAEEFSMTSEGITNRLKEMQDDDLVGRKEAGARAVIWWAKVAPRLDPEVAKEVEEAERAMTQEELEEELGIET
jgi:DNA-binding transcriptional regulator GbsR (MarR family)